MASVSKNLAACVAALAMAGCAQLSPTYGDMAAGKGGVLVYDCKHADGDKAGKAYFDKGSGLAMMALEIGIELPGKLLLMGPMLVGEAFFGAARVVFQIPEAGGGSVVTMFPAAGPGDEEPPKPQRKLGECVPVGAQGHESRIEAMRAGPPKREAEEEPDARAAAPSDGP